MKQFYELTNINKAFIRDFWSNVDKSKGSDGCWEWIGSISPNGYGRLSSKGKTVLAHRVSYVLSCGSIPNGMFVCHHCDNRICVNPDHLFIGTASDNSNDMWSKGRRIFVPKFGEEHGRAKLNNESVIQIRHLHTSGIYNIHQLAKLFSVSVTTIFGVIHHKSWRNVN